MYNIATIRNFYHGSLGNGNPLSFSNETFKTISDAEAAIEKEESATYYLSNNESGRPELMIVTKNTADWIGSGRDGDYSNYHFTDDDCGCGDCENCYDDMNDQDCESVRIEAGEIKKENEIRITCTNGNTRNKISWSRITVYRGTEIIDRFCVPKYDGKKYCKQHPSGEYGKRYFAAIAKASK